MTWLSNVLAVALTGSSIVTALPGFNSKRSDVYSSLNRRQYPDPEHDMHYRRTLSSPLIKRDTDAVAYNNCSAPVLLSGKAPKENIWGGLTNEEVTAILGYVHDPVNGLNLTEFSKKTLWDNYVYIVEQIMPNKTDALAYMDGGAPPPERYARVGISFGATESPYYEDFSVSQIPDRIERKKSNLMTGWSAPNL